MIICRSLSYWLSYGYNKIVIFLGVKPQITVYIVEMELNHKEIIIKVISGNASESEINELNVWRQLSAANENEYIETKRLWDNITGATEEFSPDEDAAWLKYSEKIHQKQPVVKQLPVFNAYRMVAGIALIAVLTVVIKFTVFNDHVGKSIISEVKTQEIKPVKEFNIISVVTTDSAKQIILPDNSVVIVNTNSDFSYYAYNNGTFGNCSLKGEAYFDITPSEKGFEVSTNNLVVKVLGTSFNIFENKDKQVTEVFVERGKVEVMAKNNSAEKLYLTANQKGKFDMKKQAFITKKKKITPTVITEVAVETETATPAKKHWWEKLREKISNVFKKKKKEENKP